jgi:methylthioribose-1-phosphate isomerase
MVGLTQRKWFSLRWHEGALEILDQTQLPEREVYLRLSSVEAIAKAIEKLAVRGAPAIGCAAAFGVVVGAEEWVDGTATQLGESLRSHVIPRLERTRPTAVNLFWALSRMRAALDALGSREDVSVREIRLGLLEEASRILDEDKGACRSIGFAGVELVPEGARILTHCNAGVLATGGWGTALGVVRAAEEAGKGVRVIASETRPLLQGARLTAWELARDGIPVRVCTDGMPAALMARGEIDLVVVGADRIAVNGDTANKIGTYGLAVLARAHDLPFYVAAPWSTIDPSIASGNEIIIEERGREELASIHGQSVLPDGVDVFAPAFDVTPARLITAIITDRGVIRPSFEERLSELDPSALG